MAQSVRISPRRSPLALIVGGLKIHGLAAFAANVVQADVQPKGDAKPKVTAAPSDDFAVTGNRAIRSTIGKSLSRPPGKRRRARPGA